MSCCVSLYQVIVKLYSLVHVICVLDVKQSWFVLKSVREGKKWCNLHRFVPGVTYCMFKLAFQKVLEKQKNHVTYSKTYKDPVYVTWGPLNLWLHKGFLGCSCHCSRLLCIKVRRGGTEANKQQVL